MGEHMLNLPYFQTLFNEPNTELRCRKVLDEVSPVIKPIFKRFVDQIDIELNDEYYIRSYDTTLTTTYHDARNPKYAEKKKDSDIGRKYYTGLFRKMDGKEYNLFTLELNGYEEAFLLHIETSFIPMWAMERNDKIHGFLNEIPSNYSIYTGTKEKEEIPLEAFIKYIKDQVKPRRRPWFQIGRSLLFSESIAEEDLIQELLSAWSGLSGVRQYISEDKEIGKKAFDALMSLASIRDIESTHLIGRDYEVTISALEDYKSNAKRQAFHIYDGDQLLTKGFFYYFDYFDKSSPFQTIMVQMEGHNHIYTNARRLLGDGIKEWWIAKAFSTHNLDNQKVMKKAMELLTDHGIEADNQRYFVGSFDNESQSFVEGAHIVKKRLLDAALLFAHASEKLVLPEEESESTVATSGDDEDGADTLDPNFYFEGIYNTITNSSFTFSQDIIRDLHLNLTALDDKHFVLLSGISGTGKTQLCRLYANAVYGLEYESENPYFTIIPVRPDWTDASALFGYYSSFEKRYVKTEFLTVLLNALKEREKPHFILLDEMNLARVEYYLSDYLSAVESRKEISLHNDDTIEDIPKKVLIPPNIYILGTINVDETTHSISDKVLDRAFVMTLSDVDFESYWKRVDPDHKVLLEKEFILLKELHASLAGFDLHFGYRTMSEIMQKLYANLQLPEEFRIEHIEALDRVISEKVLTKVRGDERISIMLDELEDWLEVHFGAESVSLQHVKRMKEELEQYGATQFWR
ncbi:hypothetical protein EQV77_13285 [Halobacillus fulvus]|nr:hypothetical protein EQV77_13285 [Halobacillus fulvus]